MNLNQVTLPASDMAESTAFYRRMGFLQIVDTPHYARFESIDGDATFSLSLEDGVAGAAVIYFEHEDLDELVAAGLQGIEGLRPHLNARDRRYFREAARRRGTGLCATSIQKGCESRETPDFGTKPGVLALTGLSSWTLPVWRSMMWRWLRSSTPTSRLTRARPKR